MKQITRWNDLVGKTITGANELYMTLIFGEEYCVFGIGGWDKEDVIISNKPTTPCALFGLGFIDEKQCRELLAELEANAKAKHEAKTKFWELSQLAYLKAKYEEK